MIALAYLLSLIKLWQMPQGGSITAGSMIPILVFAYRWGPKNGVLAGLVYGTLQFILGPKWSFHPVSILFDYSIAFAWLGLVGIFGKGVVQSILGITLGVFLRFASHVLSGVVVFASYAPEGVSPIWYSITYNGPFLAVELAISIVIMVLLFKPLEKAKILA
jgi:thiamine transporter